MVLYLKDALPARGYQTRSDSLIQRGVWLSKVAGFSYCDSLVSSRENEQMNSYRSHAHPSPSFSCPSIPLLSQKPTQVNTKTHIYNTGSASTHSTTQASAFCRLYAVTRVYISIFAHICKHITHTSQPHTIIPRTVIQTTVCSCSLQLCTANKDTCIPLCVWISCYRVCWAPALSLKKKLPHVCVPVQCNYMNRFFCPCCVVSEVSVYVAGVWSPVYVCLVSLSV